MGGGVARWAVSHHEVFKPLVGHDPETLVAAVSTPRILDPPLVDRPVCPDVVPSENHGVSHERLAMPQSLFLRHGHFGAVDQLVIDELDVKLAKIAVGVLDCPHIAAKPDWAVRIKKFLRRTL